MNFYQILQVARYNAKLLRRSWVYRVFVILAFLFILVTLLATSPMILPFVSDLHTLSNYYPAQVLALYNSLLIYPIIFLVGGFFSKSSKLDSMDVIFCKPVGNREYVLGIFWGIIRQFLIIGAILTLLVLILHLSSGNSPFDPGVYLFLFVAELVPTLVFFLGLAFLLQNLIANRAIVILLLLGYIYLLSAHLTTPLKGVFDPLGSSLPTAFSSVTGHADLAAFLLQRALWLFAGVSLTAFGLILFKRLPNRPGFKKRNLLLASASLLCAVVCGSLYFMKDQSVIDRREKYIAVSRQWAGHLEVTTLRQEIDYAQQGSRMAVTSRSAVVNETGRSVSPVVFYLNPELAVEEVKQAGTPVAFTRTRQVLSVETALAAGDSAVFEITCRGKIDPAVCYLDIEANEFTLRDHVNMSLAVNGRSYAFLSPDYTLLTPEALWYPVTRQRATPATRFSASPDFTRYTLNVAGTSPEKSIITQGKEHVHADGSFTFESEQPMPGLTLVIGPYRRHTLRVDTLTCELALFAGNSDLLDGLTALADTLPEVLSKSLTQMESKFDRSYPYRAIRLVETPCSYANFQRLQAGGNENVQPELIFFPERGQGLQNANLQQEAKQLIRQGNSSVSQQEAEVMAWDRFVLKNFFEKSGQVRIDGKKSSFNIFAGVQGMDISLYLALNPFFVYPLFFDYSLRVVSDEYPVMSLIINDMMTRSFFSLFPDPRKKMLDRQREEANSYLQQASFEEACRDSLLDKYVLEEIVGKKTDELIAWCNYQGTSVKALNEFLYDFLTRHPYSRVTFDEFDRAFEQHFGYSWRLFIDRWYRDTELPVLITRDYSEKRVADTHRNAEDTDNQIAYQIRFRVMNAGKREGLITLSVSQWRDLETQAVVSEREPLAFTYLIPPGTAVEIARTVEVIPIRYTVNTYVSGNRPDLIARQVGNRKELGVQTDSASYVRPIDPALFRLPNANEIIVDNEDPGFILKTAPVTNKWQQRLQKQAGEKKYFSLPPMSISQWGFQLDGSFYGDTIRSAVVKASGNGQSSVAWKAPIARPGKYEIYVYLPESALRRHQYGTTSLMLAAGATSASLSSGGRYPPSEIQTYRVEGETEPVELNARVQYGWTLLGTYHLPEGEHQVSLTDQGVFGQTLYADAVKWVYISDN